MTSTDPAELPSTPEEETAKSSTGRIPDFLLGIIGIVLVALALFANFVAGLRGTWQPDEACRFEDGGAADRWLFPASALCWNGAQLVSGYLTLCTVALASAGVGLVCATLARRVRRSFWGALMLASAFAAGVLLVSYAVHPLLLASGVGGHNQP